MKKYLLLMIFINSIVLAPAFSGHEGGGAPPVQVMPDSPFQYNCDIEITKTVADSTRKTGIIKASFIIDSLNVISLDTLAWAKNTEDPINVTPKDVGIRLYFEKIGSDLKAVLLIKVSQLSESKTSDINSYSQVSADFESNPKLETQAFISERMKWEDGAAPATLMRELKANLSCLRTK